MHDGFMPAAVTGALAFLSVGMCLVGLFQTLDNRVILTYADTFSGFKEVRDLLLRRTNYTVGLNPVSVYHVPYPSQVETLEELEDMRRRGLISAYNFTDPSLAIEPSLLRQLMRQSWCSTGASQAGTFPANRTPGCQCIAQAYLDFVRSSLPADATNQTVVNVSAEVRQRVSDKVYRCWDQRQVTRSVSCGRICTTHVVGLALFASIVLFLVCVSYVAFYSLSWDPLLIKGLIVLLGGVLSVPFLVQDATANALSVAGVAVCLFYLTVSLHDELDSASDKSSDPHPLTTALMVNLPLIISAHTIQIGVSGYGRDLCAFTCFGIVGALLGMVLQRLYWAGWYSDSRLPDYVWRTSLMAAYVSLQLLLVLLFVAYNFPGSLFAQGSAVYLLVLYEIFLTALAWLVSADLERKRASTFTGWQFGVMLCTTAACLGMAVVAIVDTVSL